MVISGLNRKIELPLLDFKGPPLYVGEALHVLLLVPRLCSSLLALASCLSAKTDFKVFPSAMAEASRRKSVFLALRPLGCFE
jgi:hypothetical protein